MPIFATPEPITVTIELGVGDVALSASERADTVVEVRPSDPGQDRDVRAAERTRVEYTDGRLQVVTPKGRGLGVFGKLGSVDVVIELPAGSQLRGEAGVAAVRGVGRLGECRFTTGLGDVQFDHTGPLHLNAGMGSVVVDRVAGTAEVTTGSGTVRLRQVDGTAVIKNSNGDTWVGQIAGDLQVKGANGDISVDHADAGVTARTANGQVRVGGITRGVASLDTAHGGIEIGIRAGTAARLDLHTALGRVISQLAEVDRPEPSDERVDVRARTTIGDILVHRA